jgi:hypothetical protein
LVWKTLLLQNEQSTKFLSLIEQWMPPEYDTMEYGQKLALIEEKLQDAEMRTQFVTLLQDGVTKLRNIFTDDQKIEGYIQRTESPAIQFANRIVEGMTEPRITNYQDSFPDMMGQLAKDNDFLASIAVTRMDEIAAAGSVANLMRTENELRDEQIAGLAPGALVKVADVVGRVRAAPEKGATRTASF